MGNVQGPNNADRSEREALDISQHAGIANFNGYPSGMDRNGARAIEVKPMAIRAIMDRATDEDYLEAEKPHVAVMINKTRHWLQLPTSNRLQIFVSPSLVIRMATKTGMVWAE